MKKIPKSITVICYGNMCRSPVGEYLLRYYAHQSPFPQIQAIKFDSAGTHGSWSGMDDFSEKYLHEKGIQTNEFQSKRISRAYLDNYDLILIMEEYMREEILRTKYENIDSKKRDDVQKRILTFKEAAGLQGDISDPVATSWEHYRNIMDEINRIAMEIIAKLEQSLI
jgi:protein-tyrosine-phosphatase